MNVFGVYMCVYVYTVKKVWVSRNNTTTCCMASTKTGEKQNGEKKQNELYRKNCNSFLYIFFSFICYAFFCVEKKFCVLERNEKKFCIVF